MTDISADNRLISQRETSIHTDTEARRRLAKRYGAEARFKYVGLAAVLVACGFLVLLLSTVIGQAINAFTYHFATVEVDVPAAEGGGTLEERRRALLQVDFNGAVRTAVRDLYPYVTSRRDRRALNGLLTSGAGADLRGMVLDNPDMAGTRVPVEFLLDDVGDLYMKGLVTGSDDTAGRGIASLVQSGDAIEILSTSNDFQPILAEVKAELLNKAEDLRDEYVRLGRVENRLVGQIAALARDITEASDQDRPRLTKQKEDLERSLGSIQDNRAGIEQRAVALEDRAAAVNVREVLSPDLPSFLVNVNGGVLKVVEVDVTTLKGEPIIPPESLNDAQGGDWSITRLDVPEGSRKMTDQEIVWVERLNASGAIERKFNTPFFTSGASREPERAGLWGAVVGTFFTMVMTLLLSFPIGVAAAIYLEEFAPKNRFTATIEVNINNLAAVPSIVFGLLGLAVFLNTFHLPRSAPIVGGMVLALMTLPTIIIASRAALKAVPPSIREAALGVGASKIQAVFHHVLPLALPGIMTGTIIGMAQALGETAPLLMIGMVAFIVDVPGGPLDPSTVLPVQIYMWADFPEPAFQQKTAAAILVLLGFLVVMNLLAVVLRRRFERRW